MKFTVFCALAGLLLTGCHGGGASAGTPDAPEEITHVFSRDAGGHDVINAGFFKITPPSGWRWVKHQPDGLFQVRILSPEAGNPIGSLSVRIVVANPGETLETVRADAQKRNSSVFSNYQLLLNGNMMMDGNAAWSEEFTATKDGQPYWCRDIWALRGGKLYQIRCLVADTRPGVWILDFEKTIDSWQWQPSS